MRTNMISIAIQSDDTIKADAHNTFLVLGDSEACIFFDGGRRVEQMEQLRDAVQALIDEERTIAVSVLSN